jgi:peptidoglycan/LPS O-acetylase OafA/YrhL
VLSVPEMKIPSETPYLTHLDGVRALALLGVLVFHFDPDLLPGGYVGVDCFLVLSGYLMTKNILVRLQNGTFSLKMFFVARAWRLLPASLSVNIFSTGMAYLLFPSHLAQKVAESALSSLCFASNIYFLLTANYFDSSAVLKPLLHTWSLSLEEQWYAVYPFILLAVHSWMPAIWSRRPGDDTLHRGHAVCLGLYTVVSFVLAIFMGRSNPTFVFYMLPARVYEFGCGGFALLVETLCPIHLLFANVMSSIGLLLIFSSYILLKDGVGATFCLPSVLGTVLLILTPSSWVCRNFLSHRKVVSIGRLSYAVYLVHWPCYVFGTYFLQGLQFSKPTTILAVFLMTSLLSTFLHYRVEQPMRQRKSKFSSILYILISCSFLLSCSGILSQGWKFRQGPSKPNPHNWLDRRGCVDIGKNAVGMCAVNPKSSTDLSRLDVNATIVGSSYAGHLLQGFNFLASKYNTSYLFMAHEGCPIVSETNNVPSLRPVSLENENTQRCKEINRQRWNLIETAPLNSVIVLADEWMGAQGATKALNAAKDVERYGKIAVIAGAVPLIDMNGPAPNLFADWQWLPLGNVFRGLGINLQFSLTTREPQPDRIQSNDLFLKYLNSEVHSLKYVDVFSSLCDQRSGSWKCRSTLTGEDQVERALDDDSLHFSYFGSLYVAPMFHAVISAASLNRTKNAELSIAKMNV